MGPYQRPPKSGDRAIRYSGLGVRSVGPVGDFLDIVFGLSPFPGCEFHHQEFYMFRLGDANLNLHFTRHHPQKKTGSSGCDLFGCFIRDLWKGEKSDLSRITESFSFGIDSIFYLFQSQKRQFFPCVCPPSFQGWRYHIHTLTRVVLGLDVCLQETCLLDERKVLQAELLTRQEALKKMCGASANDPWSWMMLHDAVYLSWESKGTPQCHPLQKWWSGYDDCVFNLVPKNCTIVVNTVDIRQCSFQNGLNFGFKGSCIMILLACVLNVLCPLFHLHMIPVSTLISLIFGCGIAIEHGWCWFFSSIEPV